MAFSKEARLNKQVLRAHFQTPATKPYRLHPHGQPSNKVSMGPFVIHFLQPMQSNGSTSMRIMWGTSGFCTSSIQLSTGHSVTQIGDPPHPVQASLMIASIFGLRFLFLSVSFSQQLP